MRLRSCTEVRSCEGWWAGCKEREADMHSASPARASKKGGDTGLQCYQVVLATAWRTEWVEGKKGSKRQIGRLLGWPMVTLFSTLNPTQCAQPSSKLSGQTMVPEMEFSFPAGLGLCLLDTLSLAELPHVSACRGNRLFLCVFPVRKSPSDILSLP